MNLDGIFMDMYGTIVGGDRAAVEDTCRQVIRATGVPLTAQELSIRWGDRFFAAMEHGNHDGFRTLYELERDTLHETISELGATIDPAPFAQRLVDYWRDPPLQPEVSAFFDGLTVPVCVVSNADRADLAAALVRHELPVAAAVTSEDARSYKPDREIFELALRRTGWRRECVLHVGDSLHSDVGGARAAGLRCAWVNRAHRIHDIGTEKPDYEVGDLLELRQLVARGIPGPLR